MLTVSMDGEVLDLDGGTLDSPTGKMDSNGAPLSVALTYRRAAVNALLQGSDQGQIDGETKLVRWALAKRIHAGPALELEAEEVVMIKEAIARQYAALVYGRFCELLGGD